MPLFFWQPNVFTKPVLVPVELEEARKFAWAEPFMHEVYGYAKASPQLRADPAFRDLSTIFDDTEGLVFIDYCHTTENANARIASAMAEKVHEAISVALPVDRKPAPADRGAGPKAVE